MKTMASQITSFTIVCSNGYSGADQRKHRSSASLAFVSGIHRWPMNSPQKGPVTRKLFPFDVVIVGILEECHIKYAIWFCCVLLSLDYIFAWWLNSYSLDKNGRHFGRRHFQMRFLDDNVRISIKISLKFVPKGPIKNITALVQIMAWHLRGDKPLSESMMVRLPTPFNHWKPILLVVQRVH